MDLIVVPPEFALMFFIPIIVFLITLEKLEDLGAAVFVYLTLQISLCILARHIYG